MSKFLITSNCTKPAETMALITKQKYFSTQCIGQCVSIPGKGIRIRKTEPKLNALSPDEAVRIADFAVYFQTPSDEVTLLCAQQRVLHLSAKQYTDIFPHHCNARNFSVKYHPDSFIDVLNVVIGFKIRNYRINLRSNDSELNLLFQLFHPTIVNADLNLYLNPDQQTKLYPANLETQLLDILHQEVSSTTYVSRMVAQYIYTWNTCIHQLPEHIYLTCSRQTIQMKPSLKQVMKCLESRNISQLKSMERKTLEDLTAKFVEEEYLEKHISMLLSTHHAKIANEKDVILSFLGSRRCNFRCNYCFSNHTCEALSQMSENDILNVADLVTCDCQEGLNLHIDTGLGGEPLMDFEAVRKRHNLMETYHKTTEIDASFGLLTNGSLLQKDHLDWMRTHIPYVGFSLDGDKETQNKIRHDANLAPTYHKATKGIELLKNSNWPVPTGVSCVLTKYNLDILGLQNHFRKDLDIHHVVMKPVRAAETEDYALTYDDLPKIKAGYEALFKFLHKSACAGDLDPLFTMLQPLDYAGRFFLRTYFADRLVVKRCGAGEIIYSADDKGRIYPCDSFNGVAEKELGNLETGMHNQLNFQIPFVTEKKPPYKCKTCWANARSDWSKETLEKVTEYIKQIGVSPLPSDSFVYAPC